MASFSPDSQGLSEEELEDPRTIQKLMDAAQAEGRCQEVKLPYEGRSDGGRLLIFESMIPQQYAGLALDFLAKEPWCTLFWMARCCAIQDRRKRMGCRSHPVI